MDGLAWFLIAAALGFYFFAEIKADRQREEDE